MMFDRSHSSVLTHFTSASLLSTLLLFSGCGGGPARDSKWPETHPVTGTVTKNGEPLANAVISFSPVQGNYSARATADENGEYSLRTFFSASHDDVGAAVGEYKVTLYAKGDLEEENKKKKLKDVPDVTDAASAAAAAAAQASNQYGGGRGGPRVMSGLPQEYLTPETTPLSATVTEGDNTVNLDIKF